jgi:hypothetical protein
VNLRKDHNRFPDVRTSPHCCARQRNEPPTLRPRQQKQTHSCRAWCAALETRSLNDDQHGHRATSWFKAFRPADRALDSAQPRPHRRPGAATVSQQAGPPPPPPPPPRESAFGGVHTSVGAKDERSSSSSSTRAVAVADTRSLTLEPIPTMCISSSTSTIARRNFRRPHIAAREQCISSRETYYMTLNGGSLGSWIDEERSKVR